MDNISSYSRSHASNAGSSRNEDVRSNRSNRSSLSGVARSARSAISRTANSIFGGSSSRSNASRQNTQAGNTGNSNLERSLANPEHTRYSYAPEEVRSMYALYTGSSRNNASTITPSNRTSSVAEEANDSRSTIGTTQSQVNGAGNQFNEDDCDRSFRDYSFTSNMGR